MVARGRTTCQVLHVGDVSSAHTAALLTSGRCIIHMKIWAKINTKETKNTSLLCAHTRIVHLPSSVSVDRDSLVPYKNDQTKGLLYWAKTIIESWVPHSPQKILISINQCSHVMRKQFSTPRPIPLKKKYSHAPFLKFYFTTVYKYSSLNRFFPESHNFNYALFINQICLFPTNVY